MSERGSGLLDAIAAAAIGTLVASTATDTVAAVRMLREVGERDRLLVIARNLLEQAVGAPCALPSPCPEDLACSIDRTVVAAGPPLLARIRVSVAPIDAESTVVAARLTTVRMELCP